MPHRSTRDSFIDEDRLSERQRRQLALAQWCYVQMNGFANRDERLQASLNFVFDGKDVDVEVKQCMFAFQRETKQVDQSKSLSAAVGSRRLVKRLQEHIKRRVCPSS